ncbi:MAG: endolytic transglycosylase MltG [Clostridia bacterium]|nr:endolytic transglycosylase MltG [Clostridia bacterium]
MKFGRAFAFFILTVLIVFASSCSVQGDNEETTTEAVTESTTLKDLSAAIDAFMNVTEEDSEDIGNGEEEESDSPTMYVPVSFTSPMTDEFTEKQATERITEEETTKEPTTATPERRTVKLTFGEGRTLTEIFKILDEYEVADFDELMKTAATYDYSYYPLVSKIPSDPNRCFKLEGYLFPSTYEFYINQKPQDAIGKFLRGGKANITEQMMAQASALGYTMDEVITIASIVEKEGANSNEIAKIAAVIYNRLEAGMKLQMDSSIYYIERHVKPYLTGDINRYNSYYNTYKCSALPAGPISNPGLRTIKAALNPADVDYLYFCHDENANYYYAATYDEHLENLKLAGIE